MLKNKWIKFLAKILVSTFFVWWIVRKVDWMEVGGYLKKLSLEEVFIYVVFYFAGILVSSYKWKFLANHKGINLSLGEFFKTYFSGTFINNFMPSFIGGDSFKIYRIGKISQNFKGAASSVIMDRLTGLLGAIILTIFFAVLSSQVFLENKILLVLGTLLFIGIIILFGVLKFYKNRELQTPFEFINKIFNKVIGEINHYNGSGVIWKAIGWSFVFNLIGLAGANYIIFWALDIPVGIINYLSVIFLVSVVSSIPISINNIGVKEWAYIAFFGIFGLSSGAVVSVAITSRAIQMLLSFLALPVYLKEKNN